MLPFFIFRNLDNCPLGLTVSFWYKFTRATVNKYLSKGCGAYAWRIDSTSNHDNDRGFLFQLRNCPTKEISVIVRTGSVFYQVYGNRPVSSNLFMKWSHVAFTWIHGTSGKKVAIFSDGVKINEQTVSWAI